MRFSLPGSPTRLAAVLCVLILAAAPAGAAVPRGRSASEPASSAQPGAALPQITAPSPPPAVPPGSIGERGVLVSNASAWPIVELYVSPQASPSWGQDRLGDDLLQADGHRPVRLGRTRGCGFDLLAIYDNLRREERRGVDLCHVHEVVFDGSQSSAPMDAAGATHQITLIDASPVPIQQLFLSPPDAAQWGDDRLVNSSVSVGEQRALSFVGACVADVRVVFANRAAEERRGLDLCAFPTLRIAPGWTTQDRPDTRD